MINNKYFILLLVTLIFISGCGGDNSNYSGVIATATPPPAYISSTATPVPTVMADISGYAYTLPSTDPEGTNGLLITDVPVNTTDAAGNAPLISQVSTYLQQEEPSEWATSDCQEAYNQLTTVLAGCQPATGSQVTTSYSDPNSAGLNVNSEGYFSGQLPVVANQGNVELEVATNEDEAYDVETITSSGLSASSTSGLECCPKRIIALPGDIAIFEVCSSENLKTAKLSFSLNNPSIGYVSPPVYLCVFGKNKYTKAYGFVYIKRNLTTPIDTTINAKTNTGLSLDIPVEVVKSTASISGKVFTSKQLIKGYVKSLGPKAHCKLDSSGNYSLPKVYRGHDRKVVAVYWVMENGKKKKYKQVKIIDFFSENITNFNFGEEATPTPTATETPTATYTPTDPLATLKYSDYISEKIFDQKAIWQEELGDEEGIKKTVDWLNRKLPDEPLPSEIDEAIDYAFVNTYDSYTMHFRFKNGRLRGITNRRPVEINETNTSLQTGEIYNKFCIINKSNDSPATTVKNTKILMLIPNLFDFTNTAYRNKLNSIKQSFIKEKYEVTSLEMSNFSTNNYNFVSEEGAQNNDPSKAVIHFEPKSEIVDNTLMVMMHCTIKDKSKVIMPDDWKKIDQYGIIFIATHGLFVEKNRKDGVNESGLMACPYYEDEDFQKWFNKNEEDGYCSKHWVSFGPYYTEGKSDRKQVGYYIVVLNSNFFIVNHSHFEDSLVFIDACQAWASHSNKNLMYNAKVFVGAEEDINLNAGIAMASDFFDIMMLSRTSAKNAFNHINDNLQNHVYISNPDKLHIYIDTGENGQNDNTFFPAPVNVIVE